MRPTLQRVCSNEERFAEANDEIARVAGRFAPRGSVPFLCECPSPVCTQIAELSLGEYAALRLCANQFLVASNCRGGELAGAQIVERTDRYTLVDRPSE